MRRRGLLASLLCGCQLVAGIEDRSPLADASSISSDGGPAEDARLDAPLDGVSTVPDDASPGPALIDANLPDGGCLEGFKDCVGDTPRTCTNNEWVPGTPCSGATPLCAGAGVCAVNRSCQSTAFGASASCGALGNEDCCRTLPVPGGTFNRANDNSAPATVSAFSLEKYEVTVGRFRKFVEAGRGVQTAPPAVGEGAHPKVPSSGWDAAFNANLTADTAALKAALKCDPALRTWTDAPGSAAQERLPINCVTWFEAFAFCAWDGGRLATEAEYSFTAVGGSAQRAYPWSNPPNQMLIDATYALYDCNASAPVGPPCDAADLLPGGSRSPKGDGRYGHVDMVGSVWEWLLDWSGPLPVPCVDCANLVPGTTRAELGGSFGSGVTYLPNSHRDSDPPDFRGFGHGMRCARP